MSNCESPSASGSRGQVFVLDGKMAGQLEGIRRMAYDGGELIVVDLARLGERLEKTRPLAAAAIIVTLPVLLSPA